MKYTIAALYLFALSQNAMAKNQNNIPNKVSSNFALQYGKSVIRNVKINGDTVSIKFISEKKKHIAYYRNDGLWLKTDTKVWGTWNLPKKIKNGFFKTDYKAWYIRSITAEDMPDKKTFIFNIDNSSLLDSNHMPVFLEKRFLYLDENGKQLGFLPDPS